MAGEDGGLAGPPQRIIVAAELRPPRVRYPECGGGATALSSRRLPVAGDA